MGCGNTRSFLIRALMRNVIRNILLDKHTVGEWQDWNSMDRDIFTEMMEGSDKACEGALLEGDIDMDHGESANPVLDDGEGNLVCNSEQCRWGHHYNCPKFVDISGATPGDR